MNIPHLITLLRNAIKANKPKITLRASKNILNILNILLENNYILSYTPNIDGKVHIFLDYTYKKNRIISLKHISKPSQNVYFSWKDLWKFDRDLGLIFLTTSKGIISHKTALYKGLGGEVLCYIV